MRGVVSYVWAELTMGRKRRRTAIEEAEQAEEPEKEAESPSRKRTKKVKHRKKKTRHASPENEEELPATATASAGVKPLTLKIRLGNEVVTAETSDLASVEGEGEEESVNAADISSNSLKSSSATGHLKQNSDDWGGSDDILSVGEDSYQTTLPDEVPDEADELEGGGEGEEGLEEDEEEEDEEEEVWLEALETGNVDERGYIPQKKDPSAMTARQRAIFGSKEVELLELPLMKKRVVEDEESQEMLLKKTERNKKRRMQAIKRREKHKAETVQKLLQKQSRKKEEEKKVEKTVFGPHLKYVNSYDGITVSLTEGLEYPILASSKKTIPAPPRLIGCTICSSPKKYSDSASKLPLCSSLKCYNKLKQRRLVLT